jgi:hypothetical protein
MTASFTKTTSVLGLMAGLFALPVSIPVSDASARAPLRGTHDYDFVDEFDPGRQLILAW